MQKDSTVNVTMSDYFVIFAYKVNQSYVTIIAYSSNI